MTSIFTPEGKRIAATRCSALPLVVTQVKTEDKDGYQAVQVGYGQKKAQSKPVASKLKKLKIDTLPASFCEFDLSSDKVPSPGETISITDVFAPGDDVAVTGISKGRGFAGVIKRHGFHRQPVTRGQSDRTRAPGAIGAQTPGKVVKGKKMPGHYGAKTVTVKGLKVVDVDKETNTITISGALPSHINSWLTVAKV